MGGAGDFSSAASSLNPAIMQAMLSNPELLRQTTQLLASNPDLLNMAMRGQQPGKMVYSPDHHHHV